MSVKWEKKYLPTELPQGLGGMIYVFDMNDHRLRKPHAGKTRQYASWNVGSEIGSRFVIYDL